MSSGEERLSENMDKKNQGRSPSVPQKSGSGTDNGQTSKFPQKARRREGTRQGSQGTNNNRRTTPNKFADKRPRNRGGYFNERPKEEVTEGLRAEQGSVLRLGAKKTNLNHLLNFSYKQDREHYDSRYSGYKGKAKKWAKRSSVKYNKEQFLQANCQFVVKESADYRLNSADPDTLVDWDYIEQVKIFGNEVPSCPVCLYPPVAAKMTRCGHIYCWTCMLHYLSLSEKKTWRKCPICYEAVHQDDLKSVVAMETRTYKTGDEITMCLMKREKGSTHAAPVDQWKDREGKPHSVSDSVDLCFSKLLVASPDQVQEILDSEKTALDVQMAEECATLEGSYVQAALDLLMERQVNLTLAKAAKDSLEDKMEGLGLHGRDVTALKVGSTYTPLRKDIVDYTCAFSDEEQSPPKEESTEGLPGVHSAPNLQDLSRTTSESSEDGGGSPRLPTDHVATVSVATGDGENLEVSVDEVAKDLSLPGDEVAKELSLPEDKVAPLTSLPGDRLPGATHSEAAKKDPTFYFYQACDGQQIYLHSINARCLVREYGSLSACPKTINASIVELEGISMNQELRSRLRYLSHLPLTCEFKVAELSLKPPVVSKDTIDFFSDEIAKRSRLRNRKQRDEKRQLKKMHDVQCRKYEQYPEMRAFVSSSQPFPECTTKIVRSEMPSLLAKSDTAARSESETPEETPVGSPIEATEDDGGQTGMSFAQMLRAGKMKSTGWPRVTKQDPSNLATTKKGDSDSENEDRVPVPIYRESFGDAIEAALNSYSTVKAEACTPTDPPSGGKKKKKQKKLLFTNTMSRAK